MFPQRLMKMLMIIPKTNLTKFHQINSMYSHNHQFKLKVNYRKRTLLEAKKASSLWTFTYKNQVGLKSQVRCRMRFKNYSHLLNWDIKKKGKGLMKPDHIRKWCYSNKNRSHMLWAKIDHWSNWIIIRIKNLIEAKTDKLNQILILLNNL